MRQQHQRAGCRPVGRVRPHRWHGAALLALCAGVAVAEEGAANPAPATVEVTGNYANAVGTASAASQGVVTARRIENRPTLRPAEVLEFIPGLIVTQHSGEGKANQYFLRGFNLDHGTDFATSVDGMPVNMPTHAHGHGYSDLNWLIPELVERIDYRKGPYHAEDGDFGTAGSARLRLFSTLPRAQALLTLGQDGYRRALVAAHADQERRVLYALEAARNDGPWQRPEGFGRLNGVLRYRFGGGSAETRLTAMGYAAAWHATDQIPLREVDAGRLDRFGTLNGTDGGRTRRFSLSADHAAEVPEGRFRFNAYAIRSSLNLYSDFTYFLEQPADLDAQALDGDQFEQAERRLVLGGGMSRSWSHSLGGREGTFTMGLQWRHDRLSPVGLYRSVARQRARTVQESRVRETSLGVHVQQETQWLPWLRSVAGWRVDRFDVDVDSSLPSNTGRRHAALGSPKLSLIIGPSPHTELFINAGRGFHSNDARGATARILASDPGQTVAPADLMVRGRGEELGLRTQFLPGLQSSLSLWRLDLDSELVFVGDAGDIEPQRASRRHGIEWDSHYRWNRWLQLDLNLAATRARFSQADAGGSFIPGALGRVASLGASLVDFGPWSGQFEMRYVGPRPLTEDGRQRASSALLASLRASRRLGAASTLSLDVFNLFNRRANDIEYHYASRLRGEPAAGVEDRHFHPVAPRSARLTLLHRF